MTSDKDSAIDIQGHILADASDGGLDTRVTRVGQKPVVAIVQILFIPIAIE